jgi:signal transduction histidine kinase
MALLASMKSSLRHRLLAVALLSVISCAVSLAALTRVLSLTHAQRMERARDAAAQELALLRRGGPEAPAQPTVLGMRGGYATDPAAFDRAATELDPEAQEVVARAVRAAASARGPVIEDAEIGDTMRIVGAAPADRGSYAWVEYLVKPPSFAAVWRAIVAALTIATALLVATALHAVVSVKRGAAALNGSLAALVRDLHAPVARPPLRELGELGDGIASLAQALARAQAEKERLGAELARRDRLAALGRVAAGVAHEVRNPLAAIKLRLDLRRQKQGTPPVIAEELGSISDEIVRLDRLVADMLVVAGRSSGPRSATALGALVERRVGLLRPWADERGVRIEVQGDARSELDVDAVSRALDNLVRNAVEASPRDETVAIEVSDGASGAKVRVLDHGEGVDEARLPELFEPFFTTKPEGMGLGLALSRAIAAAHEGALTYERRDRTTCFELRFPRGRSSGERPIMVEPAA